MTENELKEVLGEELFDRLSQEDKALILITAGKFDFNIEGEIPNKPFCPQPFYVIDKELGEIVLHPNFTIDIDIDDGIFRVKPENTFFAIDNRGELLILDDFGDWTFAPERYIYVFNSDYWS